MGHATIDRDGETDLDVSRVFATRQLRMRRFESIPLRGPGAAFTASQGREPGDMSTPTELADLISSIGEIGVLQPILVEEIEDQQGGPPRLLVVAGERRLRACRWGAAHLVDNPHFNAVPAIVCPGPLSDEERRIWQLIENLAREPLRPGEQAAALLLHRCAVLTGKLLKAGRPVPAEVYDLTDPVARFQALERIRAGDAETAAPWSEVLTRLGLQLSPRKARELVRAFAALPRELSEEMDAAKIALHTRIRFAMLRAGRSAAADEIWAAVKTRKRPDLLPAAVAASLANEQLGPEIAVQAAQELHEAANQARSDKLAHRNPGDAAGSVGSEVVLQGKDAGPVSSEVVRALITGLRTLTAELHAGLTLQRYDAGSLSLTMKETLTLLDAA